MFDPEFPKMQGQGHKVVEPVRFHYIAVRPRLIAGANIQGVVGTRKNHDRNMPVTRILFELLQHIDTAFAPQFKIEQNERRLTALG